jgi:hypothetical protein
VKKPSGEGRVCGDYSTGLNAAFEPNHYLLPLPDDIFAKLAGCMVVADAYLQVEVDDNSKMLLTIHTHRGLYLSTLGKTFGDKTEKQPVKVSPFTEARAKKVVDSFNTSRSARRRLDESVADSNDTSLAEKLPSSSDDTEPEDTYLEEGPSTAAESSDVDETPVQQTGQNQAPQSWNVASVSKFRNALMGIGAKKE